MLELVRELHGSHLQDGLDSKTVNATEPWTAIAGNKLPCAS